MHTSLTDPPPTGSATAPTRATAEEEELEDQKTAITHLGHELRALVEATVRTAASPDTLHRVADGVRAITSQLTGRRRSRAEMLIALYEAEGLLTNDDTVIVAARTAWPEYQHLAAYVCQPERAFREGLTHFGFYADGVIQPVIARIRAQYPAVLLSREEAERHRSGGHTALADLIDTLVKEQHRDEGSSNGIILLSPADDSETVRLDEPILNDTVTASGRPWAWTLGQRYTSLDRLKAVSRTSEL